MKKNVIIVKVIILCVLMLCWVIGVCGIDSFVASGMCWLGLLLIIVPLMVLAYMGNKGYLDDVILCFENKFRED